MVNSVFPRACRTPPIRAGARTRRAPHFSYLIPTAFIVQKDEPLTDDLPLLKAHNPVTIPGTYFSFI